MKFLNKFLNYAIGLSLLVAGVFVYLQMQKSAVTTTSKVPASAEDLANKYLQEANQKLKTDRYKVQNALREVSKNGDTLGAKAVETNPQQVSADRQIAKDIYNESQRQKSVEQKFQEELKSVQERRYQSELEKKEYIKQFKANARKNGYEIVVDDNLQVISIEPIRKPTSDVDPTALESNEY